MTEGGWIPQTPRWGIKKLGSCGLSVPDVEIRIIDLEDSGRECAPHQVGELWTRAVANALGYYKQPEVTAEKFTPDGWLRTGDLLKRDEQGYVYFCGRKDDMINCGGGNLYPKEVRIIADSTPSLGPRTLHGCATDPLDPSNALAQSRAGNLVRQRQTSVVGDEPPIRA